MADEDKLLASLSESRLPALPSEPAEPREPTEPSEITTRGRSPDEVVQAREETEPQAREPEEQEVAIPAGKKPAKGKEKTYEVNGKPYTLAELQNLEQTAQQFKALQQKHFKTIEELEAAKKVVPAAPPQPQPLQITDEKIAQVYDQFADQRVKELLAGKLIEEDLAEAWPRTLKTMIGQLRFAFDLLFEQQERIAKMEAQRQAEDQTRQSDLIEGRWRRVVNDLVDSDGKLYAGLKEQKVRDAFRTYLVEELHATQEQALGEKAPDFLRKQWVAFNSSTILDAAKNGTADKVKRQDKRFVVGESGGVRGAPSDPGEQSLLDKMIERSGRVAQ
jgi:hypothetical protein